jgi:Flp pilus assembly protein TadB
MQPANRAVQRPRCVCVLYHVPAAKRNAQPNNKELLPLLLPIFFAMLLVACVFVVVDFCVCVFVIVFVLCAASLFLFSLQIEDKRQKTTDNRSAQPKSKLLPG